MESILTRLFLAGSIFAVGLGGATTATIIGVANATYKFLIRSDYQISDQARENRELAEKVLREAEATRKAAEVIYAERELDVPIQQNYITWVSGAFFSSGSTSSTIGVTINTDWAGETHITF